MNSKASKIIGGVLTTLLALFMLWDGAMKIVKPKIVLDTSARIGFPLHALVPVGIALIAATLLYVLPQTCVLGALILTAYLGGAVDTQVRAGSSAFELLFPIIFAVLIWISMLLRERRLLALLPLRW